MIIISKIPSNILNTWNLDRKFQCKTEFITRDHSTENKICQLFEDFNIDLLKHDRHNDTATLLDLVYSYGFLPIITKPTRITDHTQTIIGISP